jgi:8-oxo-dGTP pyrophosphatase MutT (NUDIX family)
MTLQAPQNDATPTRPVIRDPRAVAVAGRDDHLPPVPQAHLTSEWLRQHLALHAQRVPVLAGDGGRGDFLTDRSPAAASVLVPLVQRAGGLTVLLTRRTDHLRDHAGQISFPGGRREPEDVDDVATALREAREEIGLDPAQVEILGSLAPYTTVTRFEVTPVVGLLAQPPRLILDAFEVAEAFEVPLAFLMNPAHHQRHEFELDGRQRQYLSMPWTAVQHTGEREYFIWGATAAMLRNLYHLLQD